MKHLAGPTVRILIDYMDYVPLCTKLKSVLETQREWPDIRQILGKWLLAVEIMSAQQLIMRKVQILFICGPSQGDGYLNRIHLADVLFSQ